MGVLLGVMVRDGGCDCMLALNESGWRPSTVMMGSGQRTKHSFSGYPRVTQGIDELKEKKKYQHLRKKILKMMVKKINGDFSWGGRSRGVFRPEGGQDFLTQQTLRLSLSIWDFC